MSVLKSVSIKAIAAGRLDTPLLTLSKVEGGVWQLELTIGGAPQCASFLAPPRQFVAVTNGDETSIESGEDLLTLRRDGELLWIGVTRSLSRELVKAQYRLNDYDDAIQELF